MATREEIYAALKNADAAGDTEAVRKLAQYLKSAPAGPTDNSAVRGFIGGVLKPLDNLATGLHAIPGVGAAMDAVDSLGTHIGLPTSQEAVQLNEAARANNSRTGWQTVGNVVGTAPLMAARVPGGAMTNAVAQGAASGALLSDAKTAGGVVSDTVFGGATGGAAHGVVSGVGHVIAPYVDEGVQALRNAGVPLTLGQLANSTETLTGRAVAGIEDRLSGLPVVGALVQNARDRGRDAYNRAVLNRALGHVGVELPDTVPVGTEGIKYAGDMLSAHYDALLPHLKFAADNQFGRDFTAAEKAIRTLPNDAQKQFHDILTDVFQGRVQNGQLDGQLLKDAQSKLTKDISDYRAGDVNQRRMAAALAQVRDGLRAAIERQNPAYGPQLRAVDAGWRELTIAEKAAAARTKNATGIFTPAEYRGAAKQADTTVRKRATTRGTAANQELTDAAVNHLDSATPDSGTAGRMAVWDALKHTVVPAGAATSGMLAPHATAGGLAVLGTGLLPYTRVGQNAINSAWLAPRPDAISAMGRALQTFPVGAPAAAATAPRKKRKS